MDGNEWRVQGYAWGLSRPLSPLTREMDAELRFASLFSPHHPDPLSGFYEVMAVGHKITSDAWEQFKRGVEDALPLFVNGEGVNFSLSQIASAIDRDVSYVKAEVAKGDLKAATDGKWRYVAPEDFEAWYKSKKWRRRNENNAE